jgi:hypothetical protein
MKKSEKIVQLEFELKSLNYDIRDMNKYQIIKYLTLKYKLLDFGSVFLEKIDAECHLEDGGVYTDKQWDYILENLEANKEYYYLECFFRLCLINFHDENNDILSSLKVLPLENC